MLIEISERKVGNLYAEDEVCIMSYNYTVGWVDTNSVA